VENEFLFDVTFVDRSPFGPFTISGPDLDGLRQLVESRLSGAERFGQPYPLDCLALNISGVNEDAAQGRIARPNTVEEYAEAIVSEYRANLQFGLARK
jgi:hypothetical protein